jgi:hypothetical protein
MTPAGNSTPLIGTCGTAGTVDGNLSVATVRYPTGIVMDPNYAADGNFFFTDAIDLNPSRVRYVNFRTSSVTIGSSTVPAASAGNAIIQTIWTVAASGNSNGRIYGLAAFSTQVCYAGGTPGNGGNGTHNVTCYDRTSSLGSPSMRAGPNELSNPPIRGGAPIDNTQEGVAATSSLLDAPYGLAFDSGGNLYISERSNHIIRMVRRWW